MPTLNAPELTTIITFAYTQTQRDYFIDNSTTITRFAK